MKSLLALSLSIVTGLAFQVLPASAQFEPGPPEGDDMQLDTPMAALPLDTPDAFPLSGGPKDGGMKFTDDQLEKFYKMKNSLLDDLGPKMTELQKQKRQLKDLLTQEKLDRSAVQATQDKINGLKSDIANAQLAFKMDMNDSLTAEQKQAIRHRQLRRGGGGHHGQMRGRRGGGGQHGQMRRGMQRGFNGSQNVVGERIPGENNFGGPRNGGGQFGAPRGGDNLTQVSESL